MNTNINNSPDKSTLIEPQPGAKLKASTVLTYTTIYERSMRNSVKRRQTTPDDPVSVTPLEMVEDWLVQAESPASWPKNLAVMKLVS